MAYYFIDFENVNAKGLEGIEELEKNDEVFIFYSKYSDKLDFELAEKMLDTKARVVNIKAVVGSKNALDFQLSSYLGYTINKDRDNEFYIISKDNGFITLEKFWKENKVKVEIRHDCKKTDEKLLKSIKEKLKDEKLAIFSSNLISKYNSKSKVYAELGKKIRDSQKTKKVYTAIKPLIENKNQDIHIDQNLLQQVKEKVKDEQTAVFAAKILTIHDTYQSVNNALIKQIRNSKKSSLIYRSIKPLINIKNKDLDILYEVEIDKNLFVKVKEKVKDEDTADIVTRILVKYDNHKDINNAINKHIKDSNKSGEIYRAIKPLIK